MKARGDGWLTCLGLCVAVILVHLYLEHRDWPSVGPWVLVAAAAFAILAVRVWRKALPDEPGK